MHQHSCIEVLRTPIKAPRANTIVECYIGNVRRECLNHMLIFGEPAMDKIISLLVLNGLHHEYWRAA